MARRAPEPAPVTLREHLRLWWRRRTSRASVVELRHQVREASEQHRTVG